MWLSNEAGMNATLTAPPSPPPAPVVVVIPTKTPPLPPSLAVAAAATTIRMQQAGERRPIGMPERTSKAQGEMGHTAANGDTLSLRTSRPCMRLLGCLFLQLD